jgi:hypothetical protein
MRSESIRNFSHFPLPVPVKFLILSVLHYDSDSFSINQTDKIINFTGAGSVGPDPAFGSATGSAQTAPPRLRIRVLVGAARIRNVFLFIFKLMLFTGNAEETSKKFSYLVAVTVGAKSLQRREKFRAVILTHLPSPPV